MNMNLFFKLLIMYRIVLTGLIILKMDPKNLIRIRCIPKHREVPTQLDNGAELKQANEQHVVLDQHSQRVPIRYNSNQLREIADNIKFQKQYKRLTHNTVINVRRLQLNKRGSRG